MALETKIWINELNVQFSLSGLENVITTITASMSGRDTHGKDVFIEDENYTVSAPVLSAFTAFESLTESDCINFVKASAFEIGYISIRISIIEVHMSSKNFLARRGISC